jgi:hypothetical protein
VVPFAGADESVNSLQHIPHIQAIDGKSQKINAHNRNSPLHLLRQVSDMTAPFLQDNTLPKHGTSTPAPTVCRESGSEDGARFDNESIPSHPAYLLPPNQQDHTRENSPPDRDLRRPGMSVFPVRPNVCQSGKLY